MNIAMKKPMKCIGDADTLIKLGLYKVSEDFITHNIPEGDNILQCLNQRQRDEILVWVICVLSLYLQQKYLF